jgi:hypothetical protein
MYEDLLWICISVSSQLFPFNLSALVLTLVNLIAIDFNLNSFYVLSGGTLCSLLCWVLSSILSMKRKQEETDIIEISKNTMLSLIICNLYWVIYYFIVTIGNSIRVVFFETAATVFELIFLYLLLLIALTLLFPCDSQKIYIDTKARWISYFIVTLNGIITSVKYAESLR